MSETEKSAAQGNLRTLEIKWLAERACVKSSWATADQRGAARARARGFILEMIEVEDAIRA